jgi:hypothetical protein
MTTGGKTIKSSTKGASIKKLGNTTSGKHGSWITKKANGSPKELDSK